MLKMCHLHGNNRLRGDCHCNSRKWSFCHRHCPCREVHAQLQAMCAGHVAAMQAAAAAAAAAPAGAAESELEDSSLFWQATLIAAATLPAAADASLLEPLEAVVGQLPEVSFCR